MPLAPGVAPRADIDPRLKIASVCRLLPSPGNPSAGVFVLNRLKALATLAEVRVIQPVPFFPAIRPAPAWARQRVRTQDDTEIIHAPMFYVPGVLKSLDGRWLARSIRPSLRALREQGLLQVIDAHFGYPEGVGCAQIARELGVPYFITIRGLETDVLQRPGVGGQLLAALRGAAGLISVSHSLRDLVVERGIDPERVLVAPNAVDRAIFRPGDRADARARVGVARNEMLIVSVGHLLSVKRHTVLVEALARVRRRTPAKLAIIGGESYEPEYPRLLASAIERAGVSGAVRLVGNLGPAEVADWLQAANVFALASAREGCCNAVLEALATGQPVVATRVGDNAHFVRDDINGRLVAPDDAHALADALDAALAREWDPHAIAKRLSVGSWTDTAAQVIEFMQAQVAFDAGDRS
jgi:glycosyltransferase involved in cell wall biosynthesis